MTEQAETADYYAEAADCDYGHTFEYIDCDNCGSPECYSICEDCGEEERVCGHDD